MKWAFWICYITFMKIYIIHTFCGVGAEVFNLSINRG